MLYWQTQQRKEILAERIETAALQLAGITDDSGIALQFGSELIEGVQAFFCLADKRHVADKVFITQWIIYVENGYVVVFQVFTP